MVSKEQLVQISESAIGQLVMIYEANPYFFYTENDLHCHLFNEIFSKLPLRDWQCVTSGKRTSILLHKEYPTKGRYDERALKEVQSGGARGHFDLCIWNPELTKEKVIRAEHSDFENEQHTFIAFELDMIERNRNLESALHHFKWDLLKLEGSKNKVEHDYQLVFARDWLHKNSFVAEAKSEVSKAHNTTVLYIEKDKGNARACTLSSKPFLDHDPIFK